MQSDAGSYSCRPWKRLLGNLISMAVADSVLRRFSHTVLNGTFRHAGDRGHSGLPRNEDLTVVDVLSWLCVTGVFEHILLGFVCSDGSQ